MYEYERLTPIAFIKVSLHPFGDGKWPRVAMIARIGPGRAGTQVSIRHLIDVHDNVLERSRDSVVEEGGNANGRGGIDVHHQRAAIVFRRNGKSLPFLWSEASDNQNIGNGIGSNVRRGNLVGPDESAVVREATFAHIQHHVEVIGIVNGGEYFEFCRSLHRSHAVNQTLPSNGIIADIVDRLLRKVVNGKKGQQPHKKQRTKVASHAADI